MDSKEYNSMYVLILQLLYGVGVAAKKKNSYIYLKYLSAKVWKIVSILQVTSGLNCWDEMLWAWKKWKRHTYVQWVYLWASFLSHALNTAKSMMPVQPLSLTKQQSQSIVPDSSVTNSYIHINTPGNKIPKESRIEGWTGTWKYIFILLFLFSWGY